MEWLDELLSLFKMALTIDHEDPCHEPDMSSLLDEILSQAVVNSHGDPLRFVHFFPPQLIPTGKHLFNWMAERRIARVTVSPHEYAPFLGSITAHAPEICQRYAPQPA